MNVSLEDQPKTERYLEHIHSKIDTGEGEAIVELGVSEDSSKRGLLQELTCLPVLK